MSNRVARILYDAQSLPPEDQMLLIEKLSEQYRAALDARGPPSSWRGLRGLAAPSLFEEDAQAYVSRTRGQSDRGTRGNGSTA